MAADSFGHLSDEELLRIANGGAHADYSALSDEDLLKIVSQDKSMLQRAGEMGLSALQTVGTVIDRAGPAQIRNLTALALGQKENNLQNNIDMITGANAPGFGEILNKADFPALDIVADEPENLKDLKVFPALDPKEEAELRTTKTGYNTNDALGLLLDFRMGDQAVNNIIKGVKAATPAIKTTTQNITNKFGGSSKVNATQEQSAMAGAQASAKQSASVGAGPSEAEISGSFIKAKAPQSLDELEKIVIPDVEMVQKGRLKQIEDIVPDMELPPLNYHYAMLEDPKSMKAMKVQFENLPSETSKKIGQYNLGMLQETGKKADEVVKSLSAGPVKNIDDAGEEFIQKISNQYSKTQDELRPSFKAMKDNSVALSDAQTQQIIRTIGENTKIGGLLKEELIPIVKDGQQVGQKVKLSLTANKPRYGVSGEEYSAIKAVIDDLNDGMSFEEIQKTREFLRKAKNTLNPEATAEVEKVRKTLLGALEDMTPDDVRPVMQKYAINEKNLENVEKIIGGKIEDLAGMYRANPDKVVSKVFSNPNYVEVVKQYAGQGAVDDMVAAFVNKGVKGSFDSATGFNPVKLRQWLKTNEQFVRNYVKPEAADRLQALADRGFLVKRFMDDVNPSGTALALKEMFDVGDIVAKVRQGGVWGYIQGEAVAKTVGAVKQKQAIKAVNKMMGESSAPAKKSIQLPKISPPSSQRVKEMGRFTVGLNAAKEVPKTAENRDENSARWIDNGLNKLNRVGGLYVNLESVKNDPKIKDLLLRASNAQTEDQLKRISEQIRNTEAFKKAPKGGPKTSNKYPMTLKQNGFKVTVKNDQDYYEARSEGWA